MVVADEDHVLAVLLDRLTSLTARTAENLEKIRRIAHKINGRVNNTGNVHLKQADDGTFETVRSVFFRSVYV